MNIIQKKKLLFFKQKQKKHTHTHILNECYFFFHKLFMKQRHLISTFLPTLIN
jgi:hypothetical protein